MSHDFWLGYLTGAGAATFAGMWGLYKMGFFDAN
jgi:hypothetical protein